MTNSVQFHGIDLQESIFMDLKFPIFMNVRVQCKNLCDCESGIY